MNRTALHHLAAAALALLLSAGIGFGAAAETNPAPPAASATPAPVTPPAAAPPAPTDKADGPQSKIDAWKVEIDQIAAGAQREGLTDKHLAELRARAETLRGQAGAIVRDIGPSVQGIEARLKQLGPTPQAKEGEAAPVESDAVKQDRDQQQKALAELEGFVKQAQVVQLKADEVIKTIGDRRRIRFTQTLTERTRSILDPNLWLEAAQALPMTFSAFLLLVGDWFRVLQNRGGSGAVFVLGLAVAVFLVTLTPIRRRILRITRRDPAIAAPPKLDRAAAAAGVVVLNVAPPVVGMLAIYLALDLFDLSPARIDQTLIALIAAVGAATALYSLGLAILAPGKPQWRLVSLGDPAAARLLGLVLAAAITFALGLFAARLMDVLFAPISLVIALAGLFAVIDSLIVMLALRTTARAFADQEETVGEEAAATPADGAGRSVIWRWVIPIAWIAASVAIGAAVIGEVSLARFIGNQILWAGSIVSTLYILLILTDEAIIATFKPMTAVGQSLIRSMGFARETVEQIGVVLAGLARMLLMTVAVLMVLTPWGVSSTDVVGSARAAFFGVQIGGFTFSLSNVLTAFVIFAIGVVLTRGVQGWLDHRFLPRTRLDVGLQNSIRTSFGYVGFVVAAMLAFSFVGIDLQSFAIVAGALSLGIGFGLQSIVSNFVSGLILLAERPIKAGDMIKIGDEQGTVRKINVRSTEIETFDRASLIVPNSSLITGSVKNWMHRDVTGRSVVNIGVVYGSDPLTVQDLLVGAARAHRLVLKFPEPKAFLVNFSETAMEFRLVCTVGNVNDAFAVESDLRVAVLKRLLDAGIEIPYGRRELHIDQLDGLKELIERVLAAPAGVKPAPETPPELG